VERKQEAEWTQATPRAAKRLGSGTLRWYHPAWQDTAVYQQIQSFLLLLVASLRARQIATIPNKTANSTVARTLGIKN